MNQNAVVKFLSEWVLNSVLLLILSVIFKGNIVLGNDKIPGSLTAVFCGLFLTFAPPASHAILKKYQYKIKDKRVEGVLLIIVNCLLIWVIKRFALITGFGVSNILLVGFIAVVASAIYIFFDKYLGELLSKN